MLSLIGGQPMPNVIAALQYRPERVVCFATERTRSEFEGLRAVLEKHGISAEVRLVDPYDIGKIASAIERRLSEESGGDWIANITGATKTMALALYRLAHARSIPIVYVVTELRKIYEYAPGGAQTERPISIRFEIPDYMTAHGFVLMEETPPDHVDAANFLACRAKNVAGLLGCIRWAVQSTKLAEGAFRLRLEYSLSKETQNVLQGLVERGILESFGSKNTRLEIVLPESSRDFIGGKWLEIYAWDVLARRGEMDDCRRGVIVRDAKGVQNELDVVVTKNAQVGILSCKTGKMEAGWIDEVAERGRMLGRYSRKFIVSTAKGISELQKDRSARLNIRLVGPEALPNLPSIVASEMDRLDAEIE